MSKLNETIRKILAEELEKDDVLSADLLNEAEDKDNDEDETDSDVETNDDNDEDKDAKVVKEKKAVRKESRKMRKEDDDSDEYDADKDDETKDKDEKVKKEARKVRKEDDLDDDGDDDENPDEDDDGDDAELMAKKQDDDVAESKKRKKKTIEEDAKDIFTNNVLDKRKEATLSKPRLDWEDLGGPTITKTAMDEGGWIKTPSRNIKQNTLVGHGEPSPESVKQFLNTNLVRTTNESIAELQAEHLKAVFESVKAIREGMDIDISSDVNALLKNENLTEGFKKKANTIFEAAVRAKVSEQFVKVNESIEEQITSLTEAYNEKISEVVQTLDEEVSTVVSTLTDNLDDYLSYAIKEWVEENKIALSQGIKTELTESFIHGLKGLFDEHYVSVPEESESLIEKMNDKIQSLEGQLNESVKANIKFAKESEEHKKEQIMTSVSEELTYTQTEKLRTLSEGIAFKSENHYRESLETLRDSYLTEDTKVKRKNPHREGVEFETDLTEEFTGIEEDTGEDLDPVMARYTKTLSRLVAKK